MDGMHVLAAWTESAHWNSTINRQYSAQTELCIRFALLFTVRQVVQRLNAINVIPSQTWTIALFIYIVCLIYLTDTVIYLSAKMTTKHVFAFSHIILFSRNEYIFLHIGEFSSLMASSSYPERPFLKTLKWDKGNSTMHSHSSGWLLFKVPQRSHKKRKNKQTSSVIFGIRFTPCGNGIHFWLLPLLAFVVISPI